jgi:hypothetical protein
MAPLGFDFTKTDIQHFFFLGFDHGPGFIGGLEPVGVKRNHQKSGRHFRKGLNFGSVTVLFFKVIVIGGLGDIQKGVGIKALHKFFALVAQITFHLKVGIEIKGKVAFILQAAAELKAHGLI